MSNVLGKLAEKIGIVVQGGTVNIGELTVAGDQQRPRPRNERLLLRQVSNEVYGRLEQSLHAQFINLDKESQPKLVSRPWDADVKIGFKDNQPLPKKTTILDVFNQNEIGGRLLILGSPGTGKTTTQLELAKSLLEQYIDKDPDYPIPVLFSLASWRQQSITDWLAAELKSKYGVRSDIGAKWIEERKLLLLLDGLDELKSEWQDACVGALNQFLLSEQSPEYIVICCRSEEYGLLKTKLQLNGAIQLKQLTDEQIQAYLSENEQSNLWSAASQNTQLLELIRTPLILSITLLVLQEVSPEEWESIQTTEDRQQTLWDVYIRQLMNPDSGSRVYEAQQIPARKQIRLWLTGLAQKLEQASQIEFLIEQMQPSLWLTRSQQKQYTGINALVGCVGLMLTASLFVLTGGYEVFDSAESGLSFTQSEWLNLTAVAWGVIGAVITGLQSGIRPIESIRWSRRQAWQKFRARFGFWFMFWFVMWFINRVIFSWRMLNTAPYTDLLDEYPRWLVFLLLYWASILAGLGWGLFLGSISALIWGGVIGGLAGPDINVKTYPNQGIRRSVMNAVFFFGMGAIAVGIIGGLWVAYLAPHMSPWLYGLSLMPMWGLAAGLLGGGKACLQHFVLRTLLYRQGKLPWNYAQFLDYCTERLFLQRVGGRYRFMHKLLQEHFAAMPLEAMPLEKRGGYD